MRDQIQCLPTPALWIPRVWRQETSPPGGFIIEAAGGANLSQRLNTGSTGFLVRKVVLYLAYFDNPIHVEFRTAANAGGALIGTESEQAVPSPDDWITFPWITPPILPAGDVWLTLRSDLDFAWYYGSRAGGTLFQDATRCAYVGAVARPDDDYSFRIHQ